MVPVNKTAITQTAKYMILQDFVAWMMPGAKGKGTQNETRSGSLRRSGIRGFCN
jgi:hypothetical protein